MCINTPGHVYENQVLSDRHRTGAGGVHGGLPEVHQQVVFLSGEQLQLHHRRAHSPTQRLLGLLTPAALLHTQANTNKHNHTHTHTHTHIIHTLPARKTENRPTLALGQFELV